MWKRIIDPGVYYQSVTGHHSSNYTSVSASPCAFIEAADSSYCSRILVANATGLASETH